jgi:tetratricopeptide (TPR) repeat protein
MRKLFDQMMESLRKFLKQRDHLLLLVPCEDSDISLLLKALRDLDRESSSDLFLLFADDFQTPDTFLDDIARRLQQEHALTNEAVGSDVPKLPPLPRAFLDPRNPPLARFEAGLQYAHSLIDFRQGQHFIWGLGPGTISDPRSYLDLLAQLLPDPEIRPWMRGARIVARVPPDFQLARSRLATANWVQVRPFVIPPNAQEEELIATSEDPKIPLGDRMQAEVQLAYLDYAHSRFDEAIKRFLRALAFFQWARIAAMESLIICGLGDIARRQENWQEAQHWYACAVEPGAKADNPVLMSHIVQNLAVVAFHENRFREAEERYGELVTLKRAMIDEDGLVEALEWQGLSQERQGAYDRAVVCWEEGTLICKAFELKHRLDPLLAHLRHGYQVLQRHGELEKFEEEWNT